MFVYTKLKGKFDTFGTSKKPRKATKKKGAGVEKGSQVKQKRQIKTEMFLWSESFSSVCLSFTPNE